MVYAKLIKLGTAKMQHNGKCLILDCELKVFKNFAWQHTRHPAFFIEFNGKRVGALWENTDRNQNKYWSGTLLGTRRVKIFLNQYAQSDFDYNVLGVETDWEGFDPKEWDTYVDPFEQKKKARKPPGAQPGPQPGSRSSAGGKAPWNEDWRDGDTTADDTDDQEHHRQSHSKREWNAVLNISRKASVPEIKAAWRKLVLRTHPDHGGKTELFLECQDAYKEAMMYHGIFI